VSELLPPKQESVNRQVRVQWISRAIDETLDNPADRMILKLYLDNYDVDEIARFAGVSSDAVRQMIDRSASGLERRLGKSLQAIQGLCSLF
jgi:DNA-directed RNA polymerase specialized sigma24 family protein